MIHTDTQRLTRASLELSSRDGRRRRTLALVTTFVLLLSASGSLVFLRDSGASPFHAAATATALAQENAKLRAELERARTELDMEQATRTELNRQAEALNAQIGELTNRLEFLAARGSRVTEPR